MLKSLFDHVNAVFTQDTTYFDSLDDADKKSYLPFMVNRFVSMNADYILLVNEANKYQMNAREHALFMTDSIPKKKQYNKYIKAEQSKYDDEVLDILALHFGISHAEAEHYVDMYEKLPNGKEEIKSIGRQHGKDL